MIAVGVNRTCARFSLQSWKPRCPIFLQALYSSPIKSINKHDPIHRQSDDLCLVVSNTTNIPASLWPWYFDLMILKKYTLLDCSGDSVTRVSSYHLYSFSSYCISNFFINFWRLWPWPFSKWPWKCIHYQRFSRRPCDISFMFLSLFLL